jgi:hypothetical protein
MWGGGDYGMQDEEEASFYCYFERSSCMSGRVLRTLSARGRRG